MFAYCGNNPILRRDSSGTLFAEILEKIDEFIYGIIDCGEDKIWGIGSDVLEFAGYSLTSELLALCTEPGNMYTAYNGSHAANLCLADTNFIATIKEHYNKNGKNSGYYISPNLTYTFPLSSDLGMALHIVNYSYHTIYISPNAKYLYVTVTDTFDFTQFKNPLKEESFVCAILWAANDIAYIDSQWGLINPVSVRITFYIPIES